MKNSISKLAHLLDDNLGRCPRCIKTAFLYAFVSWLAVFTVEFFCKRRWSGASFILSRSLLPHCGLCILRHIQDEFWRRYGLNILAAP